MLIGYDDVQQIYPTNPGGTEFYLNIADPYSGGAYTSRPTAQFNISFGKGAPRLIPSEIPIHSNRCERNCLLSPLNISQLICMLLFKISSCNIMNHLYFSRKKSMV